MEKATVCAYPQSDYALPHCKCVLCCYAHCPCINLTNRETAKHNSDTTPSIRFHIYHIIARCIAKGRTPLKDKKLCYMCKRVLPLAIQRAMM